MHHRTSVPLNRIAREESFDAFLSSVIIQAYSDALNLASFGGLFSHDSSSLRLKITPTPHSSRVRVRYDGQDFEIPSTTLGIHVRSQPSRRSYRGYSSPQERV